MSYDSALLRRKARLALTLATLALLFAPSSHAVSCGTVAAPLACSVTVGGVVKYTFSSFTLVSSGSSGAGANTYAAGDIAIDVSTGGGTSGVLKFNKLSTGPTPGVVFSANANQTSNFTFSYNVAIEPVGFAGVLFSSPFIVDLPLKSSAGNGFGSSQFIITQPGVSCVTVTSTTAANCVIPGGQPATLNAGNIVGLSGGTGNVSIGSITNLFEVATASGQGLDVDGNGSYGATTDGLLALRYLLGLRGTALISGAVGGGATRSTSTAIQQYLLGLTPP
jgi:hypothetical protein